MKVMKKMMAALLCAVVMLTMLAPAAYADEPAPSVEPTPSVEPAPEPAPPVEKQATYAGYYDRKVSQFTSKSLFIPLTIAPATYGRTVILQRYSTKKKDFVTVRTYTTEAGDIVTFNMEIPQKYRKRTTGYWRFVIPESETGLAYVSDTITVTSKNIEKLKLNSQGACIISLDTGEVIYAKNPEKTFVPASATKLMTALVALDQGKLGSYIKVTPALAKKLADISTPSLTMKAGDAYRRRDLIYAMILPSCNDAAYLLAAGAFGSQAACVAAMNKKAKQLHLKHTNFRNTYGYPKAKHYTCAYDMCLMAAAAASNPKYAKICKTYKYKFTTMNGRKYTLINGDKLNGYPGHIGGKTGFYVEENRASFTGVYEYKGKRYAVCQMYASKKSVRWKDMRKLYEYVRKYGNTKY